MSHQNMISMPITDKALSHLLSLAGCSGNCRKNCVNSKNQSCWNWTNCWKKSPIHIPRLLFHHNRHHKHTDTCSHTTPLLPHLGNSHLNWLGLTLLLPERKSTSNFSRFKSTWPKCVIKQPYRAIFRSFIEFTTFAVCSSRTQKHLRSRWMRQIR